jgi:hypothetical protein
MNERADFKDSVRQLAATVIEPPTAASKPESPPEVAEEAKQELAPEKNRLRATSTGGKSKPARTDAVSEPNVVAVTIRFPKEIDALVERASFAQRMKERWPGTKQAIHVEAARDWLRRNGYLKLDEPQPEDSETA